MTREEAIAIRQDQLNGKPVDPSLLDEALATIRDTREKKEARVHEHGRPHALLRRLTSGPVDRDQLYDEVSKSGRSIYKAVSRLQMAGLIRCEVRLTEAGLRALGLQGPRL